MMNNTGTCTSSSESDNDSEPLELKLDQHGRVLTDTSNKLNFGFRSFSNIISHSANNKSPLENIKKDLATASTKNRESKDKDKDDDDDDVDDDDDGDDDDDDDDETENDYSEGQTYWISANATPTTTLERMALDIFNFHTKDCKVDRSNSGAEWWTLAIDSDNADVAWHWDKDYGLEESGINLNPHIATITYFSQSGAPTVMLNKTAPTGYDENISGTADQCFLSRPKIGKHSSFDGRFLHSAPMELSLWPSAAKGETRYSFLVNIWLNWKPQDAVICPESVRNFLGKELVNVDFSQESVVHVLECDCNSSNSSSSSSNSSSSSRAAARTEKETDQEKEAEAATVMEWEFTMGEQEAEIRIMVPVESLLTNMSDEASNIGSMLIVEKNGVPPGVPLIIVERKEKRGMKRKKEET